jgi:hypothetical protein
MLLRRLIIRVVIVLFTSKCKLVIVPTLARNMSFLCNAYIVLVFKGHGNEMNFLGFLQKLVPYESPKLHFELFRFWLRIRGDICIRKTTPHYH